MTLFDPDDFYVQALDTTHPENLHPFLDENVASDDDLQDWYASTDGRLGFNHHLHAEQGVSS